MKPITTLALLLLALCYASTTQADTFGTGINTFNIDFVTIGDPGNVADSTGDPNPAGAVAYEYRIGKYEISEQMIEKANAQSALDGSPLNITKDSRGPDKPATRVSWFEAAKFVNWLNTNQGYMPAYKFDGNGDFLLWEPGDSGYNPNNLFRNTEATFFLPSVHEWYKAAYYDPNKDVYYDYPTGSDEVPDGLDSTSDTEYEAVYRERFGVHNAQPHDVNVVGLPSPYGTFGQGGNVWEMEETEMDLVNDSIHLARSSRGGLWSLPVVFLASTNRVSSAFPSAEFDVLGFRVASRIPEPTTTVLALAAIFFCFGRQRRYRTSVLTTDSINDK